MDDLDERYQVTEAGRVAVATDSVTTLRTFAAELDVRAEVHRRHAHDCPDSHTHRAIAEALQALATDWRTRAIQTQQQSAGAPSTTDCSQTDCSPREDPPC